LVIFLAVGEVTPASRGGRISRFGRCEFGGLAGLHTLVAVGYITLVVGYRQRHSFGVGEF
jgi:hypothetical protein